MSLFSRRPIYRTAPGFTVLELVVVVSIMAIVSLSLMGGYSNLTLTQRLNAGQDKVLAMLHEARSLAISNNAIYHVRLQDGGAVDASGQWVSYLPTTGRPKNDEQAIIIQRYTSVSDALNARTVAACTAGPNAWTVLPISPAQAQQKHDALAAQAATLDPTDPLAVSLNSQAQMYVNPATGQPYNNTRVNEVKLEAGVYLGIQAPVGATNPPDRVIFFYPDGTASENVTFFVTDLACNSVTARTSQPPFNDFRDDRVNLATYGDRNLARANAYRTQNQHIRMVQVMRGGMIKALKAEALP